ncbi:uncharacterized protein [Rutidosis leptorrhynchoides]|uniref:uncharacterized protein n=1 Tax=Rutidosis leptorrhynchoides TaxID=125765 RepID=UPI003A990B3E
MVPFPLTLSSPIMVIPNQPSITTQLESRLDAQDEKIELLSTQVQELNLSMKKIVSELPRSIEKLIADQAIEIFISGLEKDIGNWLRILNPESCDRAMDLARHVAIATAHGGNTISRRNTIIEWKASASVDRKGNPNSKGSRAYSSCSSERPNYCNEKASPITSPCYQSSKPQSQTSPHTHQAQRNPYFPNRPVNPTFTSICHLTKIDEGESTKEEENCSIKFTGVQGNLRLHGIDSPLLNHTSLNNFVERNLPQLSTKINSNTMVSQSTFSSSENLIKVKDIRESELHGSTFFSKIDFKLGFYQVGIRKSNVNKTTFVTIGGQHEFLSEPSVLTNTHALLLKWAVDTTVKINYLPRMYTDSFDLTMGSCLTPYTFLQDEKQTRQ